MHPDGKTAELNRNINGAATALTIVWPTALLAARGIDFIHGGLEPHCAVPDG